MRTNDTEYKMRNTTFFNNKKYPVDSSKFFTKTASASISINSFVRIKKKIGKTSSFSYILEKDSSCNYK